MKVFVLVFFLLPSTTILPTPVVSAVNYQSSINTIITVITILVALITFLLTVAFPIALRAYRRYEQAVKSLHAQVELVRKVEMIMAWYEIDMGSQSAKLVETKFTVRKHIENVVNPSGYEVLRSQRNACVSLVGLIVNIKMTWPKKLKSLLRFMQSEGMINEDLLTSSEYKELIKKLSEVCDDDLYEPKSRYQRLVSPNILSDFMYGMIMLVTILFSLVLVVGMIKSDVLGKIFLLLLR